MWKVVIISFLDGHKHRRVNVYNETGKKVTGSPNVPAAQFDEYIATIEKRAKERGIEVLYEFDTRRWG